MVCGELRATLMYGLGNQLFNALSVAEYAKLSKPNKCSIRLSEERYGNLIKENLNQYFDLEKLVSPCVLLAPSSKWQTGKKEIQINIKQMHYLTKNTTNSLCDSSNSLNIQFFTNYCDISGLFKTNEVNDNRFWKSLSYRLKSSKRWDTTIYYNICAHLRGRSLENLWWAKNKNLERYSIHETKSTKHQLEYMSKLKNITVISPFKKETFFNDSYAPKTQGCEKYDVKNIKTINNSCIDSALEDLTIMSRCNSIITQCRPLRISTFFLLATLLHDYKPCDCNKYSLECTEVNYRFSFKCKYNTPSFQMPYNTFKGISWNV